jgi:hypothetical protein
MQALTRGKPLREGGIIILWFIFNYTSPLPWRLGDSLFNKRATMAERSCSRFLLLFNIKDK